MKMATHISKYKYKYLTSLFTPCPLNIEQCHLNYFEDRKGHPHQFLLAGLNTVYILSEEGIEIAIQAPCIIQVAEVVKVKKEICFFMACPDGVYFIQLPRIPRKRKMRTNIDGQEDIFSDLLQDQEIKILEDDIQTIYVTEEHKVLDAKNVISLSCSHKVLMILTSENSGVLLKTYSLDGILQRNYIGNVVSSIFIPYRDTALNIKFMRLYCLMSSNCESSNFPISAHKVHPLLFEHFFGGTANEAGFVLCSEDGAVYQIDHSVLDTEKNHVENDKIVGYNIIYHLRQRIVGIVTIKEDPKLNQNESLFVIGVYGKVLHLTTMKNTAEIQMLEHTFVAPVLGVCARKNVIIHSSGQEIYVHKLKFNSIGVRNECELVSSSYLFENAIQVEIGKCEDDLFVLSRYGEVTLVNLNVGNRDEKVTNGSSTVMKDLLTSINQVSDEVSKMKQISDEQDHSLKQLAIANAQISMYHDMDKSKNQDLFDCVVNVDKEMSGSKAVYIMKLKVKNARKLDFKGIWDILVTVSSKYCAANVSRSVKLSNIQHEEIVNLSIPLDGHMLEILPLDVNLTLTLSLDLCGLMQTSKKKNVSIPVKTLELNLLHFLSFVSFQDDIVCLSPSDFVLEVTKSMPIAVLYADEVTSTKNPASASIVFPQSYIANINFNSQLKEEVIIMKQLLSELCGVTNIDQPSVKLSTPKNRSIIMSVHKIRKDTNEGYQLQIHAAVLVDLCQILVAAEQYFMYCRIKELSHIRKEQGDDYLGLIQGIHEKLTKAERELHLQNESDDETLRVLLEIGEELRALCDDVISEGQTVIVV